MQTLSTADHQAVQAFRPHPCQQLSGRIVRSPAPVEWQVVHLHALAAQALGEEFSATFAAHDQHFRIVHAQGILERRQRQQRFAVVALFRVGYVEAVGLEDRRGRRADAAPGLLRRLRPVAVEPLQPQARRRLADHHHRAVAVQVEHQRTLLRGFFQRIDRQQRQAAAMDARLAEAGGQGRALLVGARQQEPPAAHGCPASP
ncbi:Uncharacterised protein [Acinetobacter baumannii]|nr:Uncharacterised protein [Acinetobacter baumannii]